ncbi:DUF488 family protein [Sinorhizobium meliloti]|uniref:DUF488 domain-containing protein n=1 Tax=Rhizobium meliloti TaxID=382 RepID=UPI002350EC8E|nr:DUF488 domain-containing protein [Sinorhizobium meliloti]
MRWPASGSETIWHLCRTFDGAQESTFAVGHSNRSLDILRAAEIGIVADVRRFPGSRTNPQFDRDRLSRALAEFQITYEHLPLLGGRRGRTNSVAPEVNGTWRTAASTTMPTTPSRKISKRGSRS